MCHFVFVAERGKTYETKTIRTDIEGPRVEFEWGVDIGQRRTIQPEASRSLSACLEALWGFSFSA